VLVGAVLSASLVAQDDRNSAPAADTTVANDAFWAKVFTDHHVLEIELAVTREQFEGLQPTREGRNNNYPYVKARVTIDGKPFAAAGLRFKGNSSFRASEGTSKRPFKIDLNRFDKSQQLHGRTKLNLSTAFLDPAFMKEKLGYEIYRAAGMATAGAGWANVTLRIDGEKQLLGIYVLLEQVDKQFLARKLGKASKDSLLMKPEGLSDWQYFGDKAEDNARYNIKVGEKNAEQIRQFAQLMKLIESGTDDEFEQQIASRMDLQQLAGYLAATSLLANIDSYIGMPHNYYLVLDKADNLLRMLPWDLNETFGAFTMGQDPEDLANWDIDRPWVGKRRLLERLFATKSFPRIYRAALQKLVEQEFTEAKLFARLQAYEDALTPVLQANKQAAELADLRMGLDGDIAGRNAAVRRPVLAIKPFIRKRIASVKAQLAGESEGKELRRSRRR
tara:strand:- start:345 stop:1685 length:1341 start_codon:yes stop_codon:yes gene_type:complete